MKLRPFSGSSCVAFSVTVVISAPESVRSAGGVPSTVMGSPFSPTDRVRTSQEQRSQIAQGRIPRTILHERPPMHVRTGDELRGWFHAQRRGTCSNERTPYTSVIHSVTEKNQR